MGFWARNKSFSGGRAIPTVASATNIELSPAYNSFYVSGSTTIATINANSPILPGRQVTLIAAPSANITITNAGATSTKGAIDAGAGDITFAATDVVDFIQQNDGSWLERNVTDN
jgi:hypothetical protein